MTRRRLVTVAGTLLVLATVPAADAKIGTGVGVTPIALAVPARPGSTHDLQPLWVQNTGDESSIYRIELHRDSAASDAQGVPRGWVEVGKRSIQLKPGQGQWVPITLRVPRVATPGRYAARLVAGTVRDNSGGAGIGASAATELRFAVGGRSSQSPRRSGDSAIGLVAAAAATFAAAVVWRLRGGRRRDA